MMAKKKSLALLYAFIIVFCFKVMTGYAPAIVSLASFYAQCLQKPIFLRFMIGTLAGLSIVWALPASFRSRIMVGI